MVTPMLVNPKFMCILYHELQSYKSDCLGDISTWCFIGISYSLFPKYFQAQPYLLIVNCDITFLLSQYILITHPQPHIPVNLVLRVFPVSLGRPTIHQITHAEHLTLLIFHHHHIFKIRRLLPLKSLSNLFQLNHVRGP